MGRGDDVLASLLFNIELISDEKIGWEKFLLTDKSEHLHLSQREIPPELDFM